jgi:hypothetical protein
LTGGRRHVTLTVVLFALSAAMCLQEFDSCGEPRQTGDDAARVAAGTRA